MEQKEKTSATEEKTEVIKEENTEVAKKEKKLSFQELIESNKEYRREFDTRMAKGIETAIENKMAELEAQRSEAERLAKLTEEEKMKEALQTRDKRIAELEAKENARTLKDETMKILNEKEIPLSYIDLFDFVNMNAETIKNKIELLSNNLNKDKEAWLNKSLQQKPPVQNKDKSEITNKPKTYEDFVKELEK